MNLSTLAGNAPLKRQLDLQTARRGLSHAYIISGPPGSGRHTLAGLIAQALVCGGLEGPLPCALCPACRKAAAGIHPDILRVGRDGKDVSVAQIRALRGDAYIRPNEAERKVYLVENAQTMNASAQNALLKLLEEGPPYAVFLLVTDNAAALLPTVRSRCESLSLAPVSPKEALDFLHHRFPNRDGAQLDRAARACEGLLGRAVDELVGTGQPSAPRQAAAEVAGLLAAGDELALHARCVGLEKLDRETFAAMLDELLLLLRDAMVSACGAPAEADTERRAMAERLSRSLSQKRLMAAARTAERLRSACGSNAGVGHLAGWLCAALFEP